LRAVVPIIYRWRRIDRCGDHLVPVSPQRKGRRSE
jgi:hypothetical protein